jgi:hypothetical protein
MTKNIFQQREFTDEESAAAQACTNWLKENRSCLDLYLPDASVMVLEKDGLYYTSILAKGVGGNYYFMFMVDLQNQEDPVELLKEENK